MNEIIFFLRAPVECQYSSTSLNPVPPDLSIHIIVLTSNHDAVCDYILWLFFELHLIPSLKLDIFYIQYKPHWSWFSQFSLEWSQCVPLNLENIDLFTNYVNKPNHSNPLLFMTKVLEWMNSAVMELSCLFLFLWCFGFFASPLKP